MHNLSAGNLAVAAAALLAALPGAQAGLYAKNSPVLQVTGKTYNSLIAQSNHTSIVEFYAPWCGHCKNLQPHYEKAAKHLQGIAKVAAVDCDAEENKQFCGSMGIQGFPTLKIVRPGKKPGSKPIVEDYQGQRNAKTIVDAVSNQINNHVIKITDKDVGTFLSRDEKPKAILFTEKGATSSLLKSIAIDFLDVITIGQARNREAAVNEKFNIEKYPTLILLKPDSSEPFIYDGEMKKEPMVKFLSQAGEPNPDPPVKAKKPSKKESEMPVKKEKPVKKEQSAEEPAAEEKGPEVVTQVLAPALPALKGDELTANCLNTKSKTCILAFLPPGRVEPADKALEVLSHIARKHSTHGTHLFPFYEVDIDAHRKVLDTLGLHGNALILAVNGKRNWWRQYQGDLDSTSVESWIDSIRLNEGQKSKFPEGLLSEAVDAAADKTGKGEAKSEPKVTVHVDEQVDIQIEPEVEDEPSLAGTIHAQPTGGHDEL